MVTSLDQAQARINRARLALRRAGKGINYETRARQEILDARLGALKAVVDGTSTALDADLAEDFVKIGYVVTGSHGEHNPTARARAVVDRHWPAVLARRTARAEVGALKAVVDGTSTTLDAYLAEDFVRVTDHAHHRHYFKTCDDLSLSHFGVVSDLIDAAEIASADLYSAEFGWGVGGGIISLDYDAPDALIEALVAAGWSQKP